jgi:hypothetical protein
MNAIYKHPLAVQSYKQNSTPTTLSTLLNVDYIERMHEMDKRKQKSVKMLSLKKPGTPESGKL